MWAEVAGASVLSVWCFMFSFCQKLDKKMCFRWQQRRVKLMFESFLFVALETHFPKATLSTLFDTQVEIVTMWNPEQNGCFQNEELNWHAPIGLWVSKNRSHFFRSLKIISNGILIDRVKLGEMWKRPVSFLKHVHCFIVHPLLTVRVYWNYGCVISEFTVRYLPWHNLFLCACFFADIKKDFFFIIAVIFE